MKNAFLLTLYVATILVANWLTSSFGMVGAGFGLMVTAGTYSAGLALGVRDALHKTAGVRWVLVGIVAGAGLSALISPTLAVASGIAFLLSELFDLAVYTPLARKGFRRAVIASNIVGAIVDTFVFLYLAGFPITASLASGQILVKAVWMTALFLAVREGVRRALPRKSQYAEGA